MRADDDTSPASDPTECGGFRGSAHRKGARTSQARPRRLSASRVAPAAMSAWARHEQQRVDGDAVAADLEVQPRLAIRPFAHERDGRAARDLLALRDEQLRVVAVRREERLVVLDDD